LLLLTTLACGLLHRPLRADPPPQAGRTVFLAGALSDEDRITLPAAVAASEAPGVLLLETPSSRAQARAFLQAYRPERIVPVGPFPQGVPDVGTAAEPALAWGRDFPTPLQQALFPAAARVVVAPPAPRRLLLQAACLAGAMHAPLILARGHDDAGLKRALALWSPHDVVAVGGTYRLCRDLTNVRVTRLLDEAAVASACLRELRRQGPVRTLVVANPADVGPGQGGMSALAPWVAIQKHGVLLLTSERGTDVEAIVCQALRHEALARADAVILVANLAAIPVQRRRNPVPGGKDEFIEMEPLTPTGNEPFTFAVGRLFHPDPAAITLMLARQRLLPERAVGRALVASDPGGSLPLLEAFSRNTAQELGNAGYQTTGLFGHQVRGGALRQLLPEQDIFLWEGHHSTLAREYGVHRWPEPLRPSLVFLQTCLALTEEEAQPFLTRGAVGVIGSSTRTYSGSGGALAMAYFDALLYDGQSLGGSLRQAKNFLLAFTLLKEKRLGGRSQLAGANVRTAWAFTLWGDPTATLPAPPPPAGRLETARTRVHGRTVVLSVPAASHARVVTDGYTAQIRPNLRLAGLHRKVAQEEARPLVPLAFAEVHLPAVPAGHTPHLHSRLPEDCWVFLWDARRRCGYLLIRPPTQTQGEIRFHVEW
jgi:hypothetical protein